MNKFSLYDTKNVYKSGNKLWLLNEPLESVFLCDIQDDEAIFVAQYPEKSLCGRTFSHIVEINGIIFFIPEYADNVYTYNLEDSEYTKINIPFSDYDRIVSATVNEKRKILYPIVKDDFLWLTDINAGNVIKIDSRDFKFEIYEIYDSSLMNHPLLTFEAVNVDNELVIPYIDNKIIFFDMVANKTRFYEVESYTDYGEGNACFLKGVKQIYEDKMLIYSGDGRIFIKDDLALNEICNETIKEMSRDDVVYKILCIKNFLIVFYGYGKSSVLIYDLLMNQAMTIDNEYISDGGGYEEADILDNNRIMLLSWQNGINYILNLEEGKIAKCNIGVDLHRSENIEFTKLIVDKKVHSFKGFLFYVLNPDFHVDRYNFIVESHAEWDHR